MWKRKKQQKFKYLKIEKGFLDEIICINNAVIIVFEEISFHEKIKNSIQRFYKPAGLGIEKSGTSWT